MQTVGLSCFEKGPLRGPYMGVTMQTVGLSCFGKGPLCGPYMGVRPLH